MKFDEERKIQHLVQIMRSHAFHTIKLKKEIINNKINNNNNKPLGKTSGWMRLYTPILVLLEGI
jgi:hypothetical protein